MKLHVFAVLSMLVMTGMAFAKPPEDYAKGTNIYVQGCTMHALTGGYHLQAELNAPYSCEVAQ